jgi:hypothetical protein
VKNPLPQIRVSAGLAQLRKRSHASVYARLTSKETMRTYGCGSEIAIAIQMIGSIAFPLTFCLMLDRVVSLGSRRHDNRYQWIVAKCLIDEFGGVDVLVPSNAATTIIPRCTKRTRNELGPTGHTASSRGDRNSTLATMRRQRSFKRVVNTSLFRPQEHSVLGALERASCEGSFVWQTPR